VYPLEIGRSAMKFKEIEVQGWLGISNDGRRRYGLRLKSLE